MNVTPISSCEDALRHIAAWLDRELEPGTGEELERHLARCRSCYSRADFEKRLKASLAELGREPVPARLGGRIQQMISRFTTVVGE